MPRVDPQLSRRALLRIGGTTMAAALLSTNSAEVDAATVKQGLLVPGLGSANPFTIAHRGGSATWAQMSRFAYDQSVATGVNALEISLARTSDGAWFGLHDQYLDTVAVRADGSAIVSNGTSLLPSKLTWAQVQTYRIKQPPGGTGGNQPFMLLSELLDAYARTHTIFVDTKYIPYNSTTRSELISQLTSSISKTSNADPAKHFVYKGYCTACGWASDSWVQRLPRWGYFYAKEQTRLPVANPTGSKTLLEAYQQYWTLLGLDLATTTNDNSSNAALWSRTKSLYDKPLIAHVLNTKAQVATATSQGAVGVMLAAPRDVLT